jgi:hypothetical protein
MLRTSTDVGTAGPLTGRRRWPVALALAALATLALAVQHASAAPVPGVTHVSGVTFPFNGVWLESGDGGHYWDASGSGICRIDPDPASPTGFSENTGTCDVQAKKPTQAVVGPKNADGTYFVYLADMSSKSGGPVRVVYDPNADPAAPGGPGRGAIVAGSGTLLGGLNTVGFFADSAGNFKNSSVALGPCNHSTASPVSGPCTALYLGFERSKMIERINFVDQPLASQSIETISQVTDKRKGVRFGIGMFHNAGGSDDLYIDELGGNGVSMISDVAHCTPSLGPSSPTAVNPPQNQLGGCAASIVGGITTNFPQGIAVQNDPATGNGKYVYVADSPRNAGATVLRYSPTTGFQDVVSSSVTPYDSLLNPGQTVNAYTFVMGLAVNPHNGDLYVGDDPTFAILVNPPLNKGHIFKIAGGFTPECVGSATVTCTPPPPPSTVTPQLYAYGLTAPKGGMTFLPSDDGGHHWAADHSQGLCRMDVVKQAPGLHAYNAAACDDGLTLGSGGQTAYDDSIVPGTTNQHYIYVAQNDHLSPGVIRFTFDPSADGGAGGLVAGSAIVMAPNAGLGGDKANGLALGPCVKNPDGTLKFPTCKHALYMAGLLDGFVRRINNPEDDPRVQSVDVVAQTTEQRAGVGGKGINGSMGMIGDDLYLPENQGFTVVKNISQCPTTAGTTSQVCATIPLNIGQFGFIFGSAIGVDPDPQHLRSQQGLVYASISPGAANATVYQYDVATNTSRIYATQGQMPAPNTAEATVWCTLTCTRPIDPANPPGGFGAFRFAQGITTDADGNVYLTEDAFAGARGGRGHAWWMSGMAYPPAVGTPIQPPPPPAASNSCNVSVTVPALASGQTYWVQFTAHAAGTLGSTWKIPVPQSAQLILYAGNPFTGLADPVSTGPKGKGLAVQNTSNTTSFSISSASQPAGTYTVQFFNGSNAFTGTTGTLSFLNDSGTPCPSGPLTAHVIP